MKPHTYIFLALLSDARSSIKTAALTVFCLILLSVSGVSKALEAPECDQEEIQQYSSDATLEIKKALEEHIQEINEKDVEYLGYPDLACFLELFLIKSDDSPRVLRQKVEWLLDELSASVYSRLLEDASTVGSFLYDTYYRDGMCVFRQLAGEVVDAKDCPEKVRWILGEIGAQQGRRSLAEAEPVVPKSDEVKESNPELVPQGNKQPGLVWCLVGGNFSEGIIVQYSYDVCKSRGGLGFQTRQAAIKVKLQQDKARIAKKKTSTKTEKAEAKKKAEAEKKKRTEAEKEGGGAGPESNQPESEVTPARVQVVYRPLAIRARTSDEAFCYRIWKTQIKDKKGDPNKQTGIDFCWDFLNLDGTWWIAEQENLVLTPHRIEVMKGNFHSIMFGATFLGGSVEYMYRVARALRLGRGVRRDLEKAFKFYSKAASKGHSKSQYFTGLMYAEGAGVTKDMTKSIEWIREAVAAGDGDAKAYLAYLLEFGIGLPKDLVAAKKLYLEASRMRQPFAKESLERIGKE